jgi:hypothetical protein
MTYITTNLLSLPFLLLIWIIEAYLFFLAARFVLGWSASTRQSYFYQNAKLLTDPLPNMVNKLFAKLRNRSTPSWLSWVIVISFMCILRQLLVSMLLT